MRVSPETAIFATQHGGSLSLVHTKKHFGNAKRHLGTAINVSKSLAIPASLIALQIANRMLLNPSRQAAGAEMVKRSLNDMQQIGKIAGFL